MQPLDLLLPLLWLKQQLGSPDSPSLLYVRQWYREKQHSAVQHSRQWLRRLQWGCCEWGLLHLHTAVQWGVAHMVRLGACGVNLC